mmetsp:Transcript_3305/g.3622  ORF Transcript_3305/g.3622 Transcript_3305/m.3622 type:complete len:188 (-) Transcript_3305:252-815(-)
MSQSARKFPHINNLDKADPRNADLYQDISEIFTTMVPGFEKVLNNMKEDNRINALKKPYPLLGAAVRITVGGFVAVGLGVGITIGAFLLLLLGAKVGITVSNFVAVKRADPQDIQLKDCQVIVKIASVEMHSDKPEFSEGSWHLEGVDSEKIQRFRKDGLQRIQDKDFDSLIKLLYSNKGKFMFILS